MIGFGESKMQSKPDFEVDYRATCVNLGDDRLGDVSGQRDVGCGLDPLAASSRDTGWLGASVITIDYKQNTVTVQGWPPDTSLI